MLTASQPINVPLATMSTTPTLLVSHVQSTARLVPLQLYAALVSLDTTFSARFASLLVQILHFPRLIQPLEFVRPATIARPVVLPRFALLASPVNSFTMQFVTLPVRMDPSPLARSAAHVPRTVQPAKTSLSALPASPP